MAKTDWKLLSKILSSTASEQEKTRFKNWLDENQNNKDLYNKLVNYWEKPGNVNQSFEPDVDKAWRSFKSASHQKSIIYRRITGIAASILLIIGIAGYLLYQSEITDIHAGRYTTTNHKKMIILEDSSEVWLNSNSTLLVSKQFNNKLRRVTLTGEAYFRVKPDPEKAFIINAGKSKTQVLGTSFNIRAYPDEDQINVTVESGRVRFIPLRNKKSEKNLVANESGAYYKSEKRIVKSVNTNLNFLSWKTGKFKFINTPVKQVCKDLSSFYDITILPDNSISSYTLNGSFDNTSLENLLDIIDYTFDLKHYSRGDTIFLY